MYDSSIYYRRQSIAWWSNIFQGVPFTMYERGPSSAQADRVLLLRSGYLRDLAPGKGVSSSDGTNR